MPGGSSVSRSFRLCDREIDAAVQPCLVDFLGEQPLAADIRQAAVLHVVAGGVDGMLLERIDAAQHRAEPR